MRIAQVAPLIEPTPPRGYGGTERVVSWLTEELVARRHEVTLFATGDSETSAHLEAVCRQGLRSDPDVSDYIPHHTMLVDHVVQRSSDFDIVHFHLDYLHFPATRLMAAAQVTTQHGRMDLPDLASLFNRFRDVPLISISDAQRAPMPWAGWVATVYHGLPVELHRFEPDPGDYLLFLGRLSPEKRVDRAIEISDRTGIPLRIVGKTDPSESAYFADVVVPLLAHPLVEFLGEIPDDEKRDQLAGALALVFPIDWPEPFGLVMVEAMACGTPVVAFRCGAAPEIVDDGLTGAVVESVEEAVMAIERVLGMDRAACRRRFEERFSVRRMVDDHEGLYARLVESAQDLYHLRRRTAKPPDPGTGASWQS